MIERNALDLRAMLVENRFHNREVPAQTGDSNDAIGRPSRKEEASGAECAAYYPACLRRATFATRTASFLAPNVKLQIALASGIVSVEFGYAAAPLVC
mmetsp:Transcript_32548/g.98144  ORF Transcript_32548/g.98144 Transcript_32548/m.98144 type:complete len:98 (-) Transcript_32548:4489-4782(-)